VRSVAIVGGADRDDRAHASRLAAAIGPRAVSIAGLYGISRDAAILERAALVLALDSGPAHIARAVGAPTIVLFGPGSPAVWTPPGALAIQRATGCFGCRQPRCFQERRECMLDLTPASVADECVKLLLRPVAR